MNMPGNFGSFVSSIAFPYLVRTTQKREIVLLDRGGDRRDRRFLTTFPK
jgi:hypothetical protein